MCNTSGDHFHGHSHTPQIVQIMPVQQELFAVYAGVNPPEFAVHQGANGMSLAPVLFMGLIRHGDKTMVEGFSASHAIHSCEDIEGFQGYASSLEHAEKLYS